MFAVVAMGFRSTRGLHGQPGRRRKGASALASMSTEAHGKSRQEPFHVHIHDWHFVLSCMHI